MAKTLKEKRADKVKKVMKEWKDGTLHIGKSKKIVKSQDQAIKIALSESKKIKQ